MFREAVDKLKEENTKGAGLPGEIPSNLPGFNMPDDYTRKRGTAEKSAQFKQLGADVRKQMTEAEKEIEGKDSDKVVVVTAIGNPAKSQQRRTKGGKYQRSKRPCGYLFRVLEDMEVPHAPLKQDCADELDVEIPCTFVKKKAGEEFALNIIESALFASQPRFAGFFTGEGKVVKLGYNMSDTRPDPYPSLKMVDGSVKENMVMAAEKSEDGNGWDVLPEYADVFGPLFRKKTTTRRGGEHNPPPGNATMETAAAFWSMYKSKGYM